MLKYQDSSVVNCQMLQKVPERKQQDHNKLGVYRRERNYWIRWSLGKIWIRRLKITKYSSDLSYGEDLQPCTSSIYEHIWSWFRLPWTRDHIGHSLTISNYDPYPLTSSSAPEKVPISGLGPDRDQCPNMIPKETRFASQVPKLFDWS